MRQLAQPRVLISAALAALATALACYPRLALWLSRTRPLWYLEAVIFLGGTVLWGFVFAWHTRYTRRPVFTLKLEPGPFLAVTLTGLFTAVIQHLYLDPPLRLIALEDYPADLKHWLAMALFAMTFGQLFLLFAPLAWLIRLFQNRRIAIALTVGFGVVLWWIKNGSALKPVPPLMLAVLLAGHIGMGWLSVLFYLRGGMLLSWWWGLLLLARHLLDLPGNP